VKVADEKRKILVVDDDEAHLMWSTEILEQNGYDTDVARSAEAALKMVGDNSYDLIISDLVMPGMSGLEFVREIADIKENQKAIIMTGHGDVNTFIESVHGLGALEYIVKPVDTEDFITMVDKLSSMPAETEQP